MPEDPSDEFFGHLNQPERPTERKMRRPSSNSQRKPTEEDFSSVPDPFEDGPPLPAAPPPPPAAPKSPTLSERGRARIKGPGLGPGLPPSAEGKRPPSMSSGVVLTPSGVKRVDDQAKAPPKPARKASVHIPDDESDGHEESRKGSDQSDVNWEEYAAEGFPAMSAEEFGVKTRQTHSGRMVPVAIRSDLTEEALKGKSVGSKKRAGKAKAARKAKPKAPVSLLGRIGASLRLTRPKFTDEAEAEQETQAGFAPSGSLKGKGGGKTAGPARVAFNILGEVVKLIILVLVLRAYVVQVSEVKGPSMEGALQEEDRLIVERVTALVYRNEGASDGSTKGSILVRWLPEFLHPRFKRGDIVVVRSPEDPGSELVKRLIGLPGDTIKFEEGKLFVKPKGADQFVEVKEHYLDNEELEMAGGGYRSYVEGDLGPLEEGEELEVPVNRIFVLGDNRGHSNDSRRWLEIDVNKTDPPGIDNLWLHKNSIEGRVAFRLWPWGRIGFPD